MENQNSKLPEDILRAIVRIFFSDMHIIIVDLILKDNYVTEYSISKELKIGIDRTRLITNNLINEKLVSFEERLFKKINSKDDIFKKNSKKDFKLRYLYFDKVLFGYNIKKKFKRLIFNCFKEKTKSLSSFLSCPRKICNKIYKKKDIENLPIDNISGRFVCNNPLTFNIICGSKLIKERENYEIKIESFRIFKNLLESMDFSNHKKRVEGE